MARLAGYCWHYPRNVILALAGTLVVSAVGIAIPLIQRDIVDKWVEASVNPPFVRSARRLGFSMS